MPPNNHSDRITARTNYRGRPRARVYRVLDTAFTDKLLTLVDEFHPLPIGEIGSLYKSRYGNYLDVYALGLEDGILGLLVSLVDSVDLYQRIHDGRWLVEPNAKRRKQMSQIRQVPLSNGSNGYNNVMVNTVQEFMQRRDKARMEVRCAIFDEYNNYLWFSELKSMLLSPNKNYKIALSPYQMAMSRHNELFKQEVTKITNTLRRYPQGIRLNDFYTLCNIKKNILSVASIEDATNQYPEVFYRVEPDTDGIEPLLYDGTTRTYNDLTGKHLNICILNKYLMAYKAVTSGIYQKTLILLKQAGMEGLRLSTWRQSVTDPSNFPKPQMDDRLKEHDEILEGSPLSFFLVLSSFEMIEIKSHKASKNDLRIYLPKKQINWEIFMKSIINKIVVIRQTSNPNSKQTLT